MLSVPLIYPFWATSSCDGAGDEPDASELLNRSLELDGVDRGVGNRLVSGSTTTGSTTPTTAAAAASASAASAALHRPCLDRREVDREREELGTIGEAARLEP